MNKDIHVYLTQTKYKVVVNRDTHSVHSVKAAQVAHYRLRALKHLSQIALESTVAEIQKV